MTASFGLHLGALQFGQAFVGPADAPFATAFEPSLPDVNQQTLKPQPMKRLCNLTLAAFSIVTVMGIA